MHLLMGGEDQTETGAGGQAHLEPSAGDARMVGIDVEQFDPERDCDWPHEVAWASLVCADALLDALHALHRSEPGLHDDWFHHQPLSHPPRPAIEGTTCLRTV